MVKFRKNQLLQLRGGKLPLEETVDLHLKRKHPQIVEAKPARFIGEAHATSGLFIIEGQVSGELTIECARCLKRFPYSYNASSKEMFMDEDQIEFGVDEEMEIHPLESDEIDVTPYLEATVLLSLPHTIVCSDDCKGLCPECGANRNEKDCGCVVERIDPRLAVLGELFGKQDK
ncbi:DUF177 domain-containing protein [Aneurinibacillus thermoaerophilus]|uniref:DUF177 domain-containing protein n=2 Tax=Aneurinibacillus group TaxID=85151 RepID=A0A1G7WCA4_ANETH|nr:DUF177 domain-containing protein [Aneurinibacillus thermoaerophilus]MED0756749.1 DUF177 domain-containing protein [Aneurinibacillus thermoaerophilus]MED0760799.1 DUF177 domain-containing protein [Aneurinibacillus thermoaerophilus]MED0764586.1 DUF177 domain-containing protein [Aneurinibacillus thermoaerophilus]QYY41624.1 DUF177 domain-containing protein [Aneurinibacillus thermoaerophilus]SDG69439.1 uncharacterized protein SAMN04489735_1001132 [Aneurinibacillus thermoaerophilus]